MSKLYRALGLIALALLFSSSGFAEPLSTRMTATPAVAPPAPNPAARGARQKRRRRRRRKHPRKPR
jgi:hypothetical protein